MQVRYDVITRHRLSCRLFSSMSVLDGQLQFCTTTGWAYLTFHHFQSILELQKERIQLLYNNLNQYTQHISVFGQTLTTVSRKAFSLSGVLVGTCRSHIRTNLALLSLVLQCHTQIHCAVGNLDVERDVQALMKDTVVSPAENKSDFLLTDYFVSMEWKEVPLMGNLSQMMRDSFWKKTIESNCKGNISFSKWKYLNFS